MTTERIWGKDIKWGERNLLVQIKGETLLAVLEWTNTVADAVRLEGEKYEEAVTYLATRYTHSAYQNAFGHIRRMKRTKDVLRNGGHIRKNGKDIFLIDKDGHKVRSISKNDLIKLIESGTVKNTSLYPGSTNQHYE